MKRTTIMQNKIINNEIITEESGKKSIIFPFTIITILFFIWGFITALNDILIPFLKSIFTLTYFEAALVQFSFFGAYFVGSLVYFLCSVKYGDLIGKIGYKTCILWGLGIATVACILFYPAAKTQSFSLFLFALFFMGIGFTLLQIAANPYVIILGNEKSASGRLNLAQGINSLGTTIAPVIGAMVLFGRKDVSSIGIDTVESMYLLFALMFVAIACLIRFTRLPDFRNNQTIENNSALLKFPNLLLGIVAIFMYVGAEVSIGSFMISFIRQPEIAGLSAKEASHFLSFYWGGLMVGRFIGAVGMSTNLKPGIKYSLIIIILIIAFAIVWQIAGLAAAKYTAALLLLNTFSFFTGRFIPARILSVFALVAAGLVFFTVFSKSSLVIWALVGTGLFNSIMWANIFSLALKGLGRYTSQGSSLLIMAILGAALIPALQGITADKIGLQLSFTIPALCYVYLCFYGIWSQRRNRENLIFTDPLAKNYDAKQNEIFVNNETDKTFI